MGTARLGSGTASSTTYLRGDQTWAAVAAGTSFDIHDDLTVVTIADADRLAFSDENSFGDPMGYTTAANLANYMQTEVELNASTVTAGTFSTARIPNLAASKITSGVLGTGPSRHRDGEQFNVLAGRWGVGGRSCRNIFRYP